MRLDGHAYPLTKKRELKKSVNAFVQFGRENLYGKLSEILHFRNTSSIDVTSTLLSIAHDLDHHQPSAASLYEIQQVLEYDLMSLLLNPNVVTQQRLSIQKQDYIFTFLSNNPIPCSNDFNLVWHRFLKYM